MKVPGRSGRERELKQNENIPEQAAQRENENVPVTSGRERMKNQIRQAKARWGKPTFMKAVAEGVAAPVERVPYRESQERGVKAPHGEPKASQEGPAASSQNTWPLRWQTPAAHGGRGRADGRSPSSRTGFYNDPPAAALRLPPNTRAQSGTNGRGRGTAAGGHCAKSQPRGAWLVRCSWTE